ncbi:hypothetical protein AT575_08075 [Streptococcus penaeicida]|uniref:Gram-positive cocci surface proteins LPxTG domain-containing protein n=1 Tax=Streptococcus penaeicida TaxID=1765960 RepID=A0A2N8LAN7_9STRE|nr:LPXTG cell wall anchor domain-containing protein [Streptococcus penaeicida]PND47226.1 hypothetical protein AT575_08075 [Streptococcus penaeicida]
MDKKQKARKHLLRRLITNAALAGTAFSTFGGALATTMEVKADERRLPQIEKEVENGLLKVIVDNKFDRNDERSIATIRELLNNANKDTLFRLLKGFDPSDVTYPNSMLDFLDRRIGGLRDGYNSASLRSLLVETLKGKVTEVEEKRQLIELLNKDKENALENIQDKEAELLLVNDELKHLENEKIKIESQLEEKGLEAESKGQKLKEAEAELVDTKDKLASEKIRANLNGYGMIELKAELEKVNKEHDDFAKLAAAAQEDYEKELALDEQKLKDQEDKNKELSANLKTAEEFYHESQAKLAEAEKAKTQLMSELENAQKALETAESSMSEYSEKVETLKAELEASKTEAEDLKAKAEEVDKELASTKEAKASLEKEIEDMKAKQAEEVAKLEALLKEKGADISRLETELANKVKAFEDKEKMSEQEKAQFQADIERLQKELADKMTAKMPEPLANKGDGQEKSLPNPVNHNIPKVEEKKEESHQLPSTGEKAANPLLVAAGLTFLLGAGTYAYAGRSKKD